MLIVVNEDFSPNLDQAFIANIVLIVIVLTFFAVVACIEFIVLRLRGGAKVKQHVKALQAT